jgi:hypothetical protein
VPFAKLTVMSPPAATPSDLDPDVLATGRTEVTTIFVAMSGRDPDGRDADYLAWHALDHRPEMHRLALLRGAQRLVSTPACRAARLVSDERYDAVDHVMIYLFAHRAALESMGTLAAALVAAGRMPLRLPMVELGAYDLAGIAAARRVLVGADVIPWRPATGVYLLVERGAGPAADLTETPGVAGVWWFRSDGGPPRGAPGDVPLQITYCYLDDDPVAVAERLRPAVEQRWTDGDVVPLLAAPFHVPVDFDWGRHLP